MSRRGRGRGSGRDGRSDIPGFNDPSIQPDTRPSELNPPYNVPVAAAPTEKEKREVSYYLSLREQVHKGPVYTKPQARDPTKLSKTYEANQINDQYNNKLKPELDPFDGMPRYSWKYDEKKRIIPQLSERPFDKSLFPKELWSVLEGEEGRAIRKTINQGIRKKAEMLAASSKGKEPAFSTKDKTQKMLDKIKNVVEADEGDADIEGEEDEEDPQDEEKDYDYEEDEADMGGDYAAEQYFDGGDGDDDDGDAGGEDGF